MHDAAGEGISKFCTRSLPTFEVRLMQHARIVRNPIFYSNVIEIQDYREEGLEMLVKPVMRPLLLNGADQVKINAVLDSIVERALKRTFTATKKSDYMDTGNFIPTFKCFERLFSTFFYALSNCCRGNMPINFESQMFLCTNDKY